MRKFTKKPKGDVVSIPAGNITPLRVGDRIREMYADPWRAGTILELLPNGYAKVEWDYSEGDDIEVVDATYLEPWDGSYEDYTVEASHSLGEVDKVPIYEDESGVYIYTKKGGQGRQEFESWEEAVDWIENNRESIQCGTSLDPSYADMCRSVVNRIGVNSPAYRGARQPEYNPGEINPTEFPDSMRPKYYDFEPTEDGISLYYLTQGSFDDTDVEAFKQEVGRCVNYLWDRLCENVGVDFEYPMIELDVTSRDGEYFGHWSGSYTWY